MTAKNAGTEILMWLLDQSLEIVSIVKETSRNVLNTNFSLSQSS
jgi:hypothetical protein